VTFLSQNENEQPEVLALVLSSKQREFEHICPEQTDRWLGQEIMVVVGIVQFYWIATGFSSENLGKQRRIYQAFRLSHCSLEIKALAEDVAQSYELMEDWDHGID